MTGTGELRDDALVAPPRTVHGLARAQLAALGRALDLAPTRHDVIAATFGHLAARWRDEPLDRAPRWSGMTDDCSPVEWSVAFRTGPPDLRVLLEAQGEPASVATYWEASRDLTRGVVEGLGADDALISSVVDLFTPTATDLYAAAYHGIEFRHDGSTLTKVYVNPALGGDRWTVARAALDRLGLRGQVDALLAEVGPLDLPLIAFDLEPLERARIKLYLRSTSFGALEAVGDLCDPPCAADYRPFVATLHGDRALPRPPFVALHLAAASGHGTTQPTRAVLSVPVVDDSDDIDDVDATEATVERIAALLVTHGLDPSPYRRATEALRAVRPEGTPDRLGAHGMHSWVSFQRESDGSPRVTVYFRLRAFAHRYGWLGADPVRTWPSPVIEEP